jgi:hypothetical protein
MSTGGMDRTNMLERHCGLLLRAYPEAYRSERGEEIIGTLLETTPEGRAWPLPMDIRGLVIGGLRARAALNRRNTTAANLRVAVFVGVAAYLAYVVAGVLGGLKTAADQGLQFRWPTLFVITLIAVTLALAWLAGRRAIVLTSALSAAAVLVVAGPWRPFAFGLAVTVLAGLAVLIALASRERPDRRWLWLIGPIVLARLLISTGAGIGVRAALCLLLILAIVSITWLAIDARPTIAIVVFLLAFENTPVARASIASGSHMPLLGFCAVIAAVAVWRLRRQSADPRRPTRI